jgi:hypothetical protein
MLTILTVACKCDVNNEMSFFNFSQDQRQPSSLQQQQHRSEGLDHNINAIKQSIYDCINELIAQHEEQPDHLANIFQVRQRL